jgi:phage tail sheath protein FI
LWFGGHRLGNWGLPAADAVSYARLATAFTAILGNGVDASPVAANTNTALDLFANADSIDVSLLMAGATNGNDIPNKLVTLAESRKDCMVFISPNKADVVDNAGTESANIAATVATFTTSSYAVVDSGWKYQYDKYNDVYRWVPLNGDIAGLCVRTDNERDPWFSPAGTTRGVIKNVVKLAWNPNKAERDSLYQKGVNSVVTFPGEGTILYGDKTFLNRPSISAFDRINVRRLFIVLEKSIARAARSSLFEFNDDFTRAAFVNLVEPYLRDVKGRRGVYDYRVVCDTTNNTGEVIDRNEFVGDIYIKPARSINFIQLNFVAVRTGVAFEEVVGKF